VARRHHGVHSRTSSSAGPDAVVQALSFRRGTGTRGPDRHRWRADRFLASDTRRGPGGARRTLLNSGDVREDLAGVTIADDDDPAPDVVIVGGAFLLGLEAAAHVEAEVVGKPAAGFFAA
jgi:hypothetical protein